jgi:hypothetical protein
VYFWIGALPGRFTAETGGPARADKQMEKSPDTIERALRGRRPVVMSGS